MTLQPPLQPSLPKSRLATPGPLPRGRAYNYRPKSRPVRVALLTTGAEVRPLEEVSMLPAWEPADLAPWIEERFTRSRGPGGQHVNKTSTRVELLLDFERCTAFSEEQRGRIRSRLASRLAHDGRLRVVSQDDRSQAANRTHAWDRLTELLRSALRRQRPRVATRPTGGSRQRRLKAKRVRGAVKQQRRGPSEE